MQEFVVDIPRDEWWTQNRRGHWRVKFAHTSAVKQRAMEFRQILAPKRPPQATTLSSARHRDHPPIDPRALRPGERGAHGQSHP